MTAPIDEFTDPPRGPEEPRRQIAVALAHQFGSDGAPEVVASGHGAVAEQILEIAFAAGVKVRTDPDLANLLSLVEVGEEIPAEAFVAVAEVLAYVYRASAETGTGTGTGQGDRP